MLNTIRNYFIILLGVVVILAFINNDIYIWVANRAVLVGFPIVLLLVLAMNTYFSFRTKCGLKKQIKQSIKLLKKSIEKKEFHNNNDNIYSRLWNKTLKMKVGKKQQELQEIMSQGVDLLLQDKKAPKLETLHLLDFTTNKIICSQCKTFYHTVLMDEWWYGETPPYNPINENTKTILFDTDLRAVNYHREKCPKCKSKNEISDIEIDSFLFLQDFTLIMPDGKKVSFAENAKGLEVFFEYEQMWDIREDKLCYINLKSNEILETICKDEITQIFGKTELKIAPQENYYFCFYLKYNDDAWDDTSQLLIGNQRSIGYKELTSKAIDWILSLDNFRHKSFLKSIKESQEGEFLIYRKCGIRDIRFNISVDKLNQIIFVLISLCFSLFFIFPNWKIEFFIAMIILLPIMFMTFPFKKKLATSFVVNIDDSETKGDLTSSENSPLSPWCSFEPIPLQQIIPSNSQCYGWTVFARRNDMDELAVMNQKGEIATVHYQIGNHKYVDFTGYFPNYQAWKTQIFIEGDNDEFLSPNNFLIYDEAECITREDWQNLCLWLVMRGSNDLLIIDVAANGMDDWQFRKEDTDHIRKQAGILNIPEKEKLKRIELMRVSQYHARKISLEELISHMEAVWLRHRHYEDLEIWFELSESLKSYNYDEDALFYKLDAQNPLKSVEEILRKNGKI